MPAPLTSKNRQNKHWNSLNPNLEFMLILISFGTQKRTLQQNIFQLSQKYYIKILKLISNKASFKKFRSHRALFFWTSHSRPDILVRAKKKTEQVTRHSFSVRRSQDFNKIVMFAMKFTKQGLTYAVFNKATLHLRCYADASFVSIDDLSSHLGFTVTLYDGSGRCHRLDY